MTNWNPSTSTLIVGLTRSLEQTDIMYRTQLGVRSRLNHSVRLSLIGMLGLGSALLPLDLWGDDAEAVPYTLNDIIPAGINGTIIIHGAGEVAESFRREFVQAAGGEEAHIVAITLGAVRNAPAANLTRAGAADEQSKVEALEDEAWRAIDSRSFLHLRVRNPEQLAEDRFLAPLAEANGVWFSGDSLSNVDWSSDALAAALQGVLDRGGLIGGSQSIAVLADKYTVGASGELQTMPGLGLIPQVIITHQPSPGRPGYVSLHVGADTVAFLHGRSLGVVGDESVTITPYYHVALEGDTFELSDGQMADYTALRRMATLGPRFMRGEEEPAACEVESGSLMIVGGGGFTREMVAKFIELAGGNEARIVIVPTADENPRVDERGDVQLFLDAGAASAVVLHTSDRTSADSEEFIEPLKDATGIWFGGGRQWRLLDAYTGTRTELAMREVLARGGVIGGSSAGATIQGDFLVRGNPLGNTDMMSAGYEDGFCYLPGCAIDQHFTQRGRGPDMVLFKTHLPRMLGIGIDETTAIIVSGRQAEVMGENNVYFYDGTTVDEAENATEVSVGKVYDLVERRIIE